MLTPISGRFLPLSSQKSLTPQVTCFWESSSFNKGGGVPTLLEYCSNNSTKNSLIVTMMKIKNTPEEILVTAKEIYISPLVLLLLLILFGLNATLNDKIFTCVVLCFVGSINVLNKVSV